jgi:hypothetical protein
LNSVLGDELTSAKVELTKDWMNHGRVAQPRIIFYFASCPTSNKGFIWRGRCYDF